MGIVISQMAVEQLQQQQQYWQQTLAGAPPVIDLPTDHPRSAHSVRCAASIDICFDPVLTEGLRQLVPGTSHGLLSALAAVFNLLLQRYSRQEDICLGYALAKNADFSASNTLVLRSQLDSTQSFSSLLAQVQSSILAGQANQDLPFARILADLYPQTDASYPPLFQVFLGLNHTALVAAGYQAPAADLMLLLDESAQGLTGRLEYNTALFEPASILRMRGHLETLLAAVLANPQAVIGDLPILTKQEEQQLLQDFSGISEDYPHDHLIHEMFEKQAASVPERIAASWGEQQISYAQLNRRANQLARHLRALGVQKGERVTICFERGLDVLVALLGTLKAGGVYVPVDPGYPADRIAHILSDSAPQAVITQAELAADFADFSVPVVVLDDAAHVASLTSLPDHNLDALEVGVLPTDLAYIIYTSGSTGMPKGVMIEHAGIPRIFGAAQRYNQFNPDDVWTVFHSVAFDFSVWEIWGGLIHGGRLVMVPGEIARIPQEFYALLCREKVSVLNQTPSAFRQLVAAQSESEEKHCLRRIVFAGEAIELQTLNRWFAQNDPVATTLVNMYGATESTVHATYCAISATQAATAARGVCGRPLAGYRIYVLDSKLRPVPIGVAGDIYIGGRCVARGYLNRAELNAERYLANPFCPDSNERIYLSGDVGFWTAEGTLEFLGRSDFQVKIRGFRIELGEIEHALLGCEGVGEAVVLAREDIPGDKRLVAYVAPKRGYQLQISQLRAQLQASLPEYMIPAQWVVMEALPLNPNRKIDRKALPIPAGTRNDAGAAYVAPRTPSETALATIWAELLRLDRVGIDDDFFALGGNSLLATQLITRLRNTLGSAVSLRDLFEAPNIAALAATLNQANPAQGGPVLRARAQGSRSRASFAQQRLWLAEQFEPGTALYNMPSAWRIEGDLHIALLEQSLNLIIARHEVLRTTFSTEDGQLYQTVLPNRSLSLSLRQLPNAEAVTVAMQEEADQAFDVLNDCLLRVQLLSYQPQEYILLITLHHMIADGWSSRILLEELGQLYQSLQAGQASPLPPLSVQYADFSAWQHELLAQAHIQSQLEYWRKTLDGAVAVLEMPTDRPRPAQMTHRGATLEFSLSPATTNRLRQLGQAHQASLFMCLAAVFNILLQRYSRQNEICLGYPVANRTELELEGMLGFFANTLVLRTQLDAQPSFLSLLNQVRSAVLDGDANQDVPFEQVVAALCAERSSSHAPLFQAMLGLNNTGQAKLDLAQLKVSAVTSRYSIAKYDLMLLLDELDGGLCGALEYNTDLFDEATMQRLCGHYHNLLEAVLAQPEAALKDLSLMSESERQQILLASNCQPQPAQFPWHIEHSVVDVWYARLAAAHSAHALEYQGGSLSFEQLEDWSNRIANGLLRQGIEAGDKVAIMLPRSPEFIAIALATLKVGACYVPLDSQYPLERKLFILRDCAAKLLLLAQPEDGVALCAQLPLACLSVAQISADQAIAPTLVPTTLRPNAEAIAYIMYTSGSTGQPKGVEIPHAGIVRLVEQANYCTFNPEVRILQAASIAFDAATFEIWGSLLNGGTLIILPDGPNSLADISDAIVHGRISTMFCTAALFFQLAQYELGCFQGMREILVGGDVVNPAAVWRVLDAYPDLRVVNGYGPTENTTFSTYRPITVKQLPAQAGQRQFPKLARNQNLPLGHPIGGTECLLLDADLNLLPVGIPGQLYLGGSGLARSYLNRPEANATQFIEHPFSAHAGAKLYRSGDLCKWSADGELLFLGRLDNQVKIRGFRVELDEVQAQIEAWEQVSMARVIAHEYGPGDRRIVAWVVPKKPAEVHCAQQQQAWLAQLRGFISARQPAFMVPSVFVVLPELPLNRNGKIDLQRLQVPEQELSQELTQAVPEGDATPSSAVEQFLHDIWCDVLGHTELAIDDDFFEIGGHSLAVMQVNARIKDQLGLHLPVKVLFQKRTIRFFSEAIEELLTEEIE